MEHDPIDDAVMRALAGPGEFYIAPVSTWAPRSYVSGGVFTDTWASAGAPGLWTAAGRVTVGLRIFSLDEPEPAPVNFGNPEPVLALATPRWRCELDGAHWTVPLPETPEAVRLMLARQGLGEPKPLAFAFGYEARGWTDRLVVDHVEVPRGVSEPAAFTFTGRWTIVQAAEHRGTLPANGKGGST
jgi:hypothetical protein